VRSTSLHVLDRLCHLASQGGGRGEEAPTRVRPQLARQRSAGPKLAHPPLPPCPICPCRRVPSCSRSRASQGQGGVWVGCAVAWRAGGRIPVGWVGCSSGLTTCRTKNGRMAAHQGGTAGAVMHHARGGAAG
jgi:hypothetical protein